MSKFRRKSWRWGQSCYHFCPPIKIPVESLSGHTFRLLPGKEWLMRKVWQKDFHLVSDSNLRISPEKDHFYGLIALLSGARAFKWYTCLLSPIWQLSKTIFYLLTSTGHLRVKSLSIYKLFIHFHEFWSFFFKKTLKLSHWNISPIHLYHVSPVLEGLDHY